ncbi:MAG: hypothetical protein K8S00_01635, partial [Bacteroidales bacterium]|nr:hypothetical protein [Bacteroidales bacterium]
LAKKNIVNIAERGNYQRKNIPKKLFLTTNSGKEKGVTAEKVVATIAVPANRRGRFLPERKN